MYSPYILCNEYICTNCHNPFKIGTTVRCTKASQKKKIKDCFPKIYKHFIVSFTGYLSPIHNFHTKNKEYIESFPKNKE